MDIQPQKRFKILLIGDDCTDVYKFGTVDRISPEAPVPVFKLQSIEERPGMAGNVLLNLENLGCEVTFVTGHKSIKTRLIDVRSKQHIVRIDEDVVSQPIYNLDKDNRRFPNLSGYHAIVISDYEKGSVTYELIEYLRQNYDGPIILDTKKQDLARFWGVIVKVNEQEYNNRWSINDKLIVTLGEKGAIWKELDNSKSFPAPKVQVVDVCGAGDTFTAAFTYAFLSSSGDMNYSMNFAIKTGAISVQHLGCYAPTLEECNAFRRFC